jgi:PadR family transcriptional regulator, regulatory protein PadR
MPPREKKAELLQGTLDMLILKSLAVGPRHGYAVARWIAASAENALQIEEGSLYPALHRLERRGWITSSWGQSESNRKAKFYQLTRTGRAGLGRQMDTWATLVSAITLVLNAEAGEGVS